MCHRQTHKMRIHVNVQSGIHKDCQITFTLDVTLYSGIKMSPFWILLELRMMEACSDN